MITNIKELQNNIFPDYSDICSMKSNYPVEGDVYFDSGSFETWIFDGIEWNKLQILHEQYVDKTKLRKSKINKIISSE